MKLIHGEWNLTMKLIKLRVFIQNMICKNKIYLNKIEQ